MKEKKFTRLQNYSTERCLTHIQYLQVFLIIDTCASIGWNRFFPIFPYIDIRILLLEAIPEMLVCYMSSTRLSGSSILA